MKHFRLAVFLTLASLFVLPMALAAADGFIVFNNGSGLSKTNLEGLEEQALTSDSRDTFARISPDGQRIVFWRGTSLYTMASDGSDQQPLLSNIALRQGRHLCWNADGSRIAFAEGVPGNTKLHTVDADGTDHRIVSTADDFGQSPWCDWTADDRKIYISFGQPANAAALEITVCQTDGSGCRQITHSPGSLLSELPVLSSDRSFLFFVQRQGPFSPPRTLFRAQLDGGDMVALTDGTSRIVPVASFDGRFYFFDEIARRNYQLFSIREDGTDRRRESSRPGGILPSGHIFVGDLGPQVTFDGFDEDLSDRWLISQGNQVAPGVGRCTFERNPQGNVFCGDLVESRPDLGRARLQSVVIDGARLGAEITSRNLFPAEGTFAAKVRLEGPSEPARSHASIKAFFTFDSFGSEQWRMEHDFEILTGDSRLYEQKGWASREQLRALPSPRLSTVTHADGGVSVQPSGLVSLGALGSDVLTLVVNVRCTLNCGLQVPRVLEATYHVVTPDGSVLSLGTTETVHTDFIPTLHALFNVWWLDPADLDGGPGDRRGPPTSNAFPDEAAPQSLDIDWFLHSLERLDPLETHQLGEDLDAAS